MVRKTRSDKKETTCKRCGKKCSTPQKLCEHLRRKNPCKALQGDVAIQKPGQTSSKVPNKDTPFKNPKIEWNYQNIKRKLGVFENLQHESCCTSAEFDRKRFYFEMKKEDNRGYTGSHPSKWSMFLGEAIGYLQRDFNYSDRKEIIAEIHKEIFPESEALVKTPIIHSSERRSIGAPAPRQRKDKRYISKEEAQKWVNPNNRKPDEHFRTWGARLLKRWNDLDLDDRDRPENLRECELIHHDLLQYDPEANRPPTREEIEEDELEEFPETDPMAGPGPRTQAFRKENKSKNLMNEEFVRLGEIKEGQERPKEDLVFRKQELGLAVKRRAVVVYNAKVPKSQPDNGNDIRKFLESRRKQFRELLEKEYDKRGQFKFALCSLGKFLLDDKPGNENKKVREVIGYEINKL
ncbi:hypothetical protein C1646_674443 [Rhizophagus diaphanus]|nr:hypothetical protein C1646_674443 [Rhizophagus diaphanus] [Rhizophagus sp. MUCL 43196]